MSKNYAFSATKRERAGKGIARSLRREGRIPAVIYGDNKAPINISLDGNKINVQYLKGHMFTSLCDLDIDGKTHLVLARDLQLNPVTDIVEHADFLRVTAKTKIAVNVPVHFINEDKCPSIEGKGVLNITRHTVELLCSAVKIPDYLEVSVEGKKHGDSVKISDATMPDGSSAVITDRDFTIATLIPPKTADQEAAEDAAADDAGDGIISDEEVATAAVEDDKA